MSAMSGCAEGSLKVRPRTTLVGISALCGSLTTIVFVQRVRTGKAESCTSDRKLAVQGGLPDIEAEIAKLAAQVRVSCARLHGLECLQVLCSAGLLAAADMCPRYKGHVLQLRELGWCRRLCCSKYRRPRPCVYIQLWGMQERCSRR